jgi:hypothetical protein
MFSRKCRLYNAESLSDMTRPVKDAQGHNCSLPLKNQHLSRATLIHFFKPQSDSYSGRNSNQIPPKCETGMLAIIPRYCMWYYEQKVFIHSTVRSEITLGRTKEHHWLLSASLIYHTRREGGHRDWWVAGLRTVRPSESQAACRALCTILPHYMKTLQDAVIIGCVQT